MFNNLYIFLRQDNSYSIWNELQKWLYLTSQGDRGAFSHLLQAFWNKVYTYTLGYTNPSIAYEITQAVFLKIWSDREGLNAIENFSAYLFSIIRTEIIAIPLKNRRLHLANGVPADAGLFSEKAMEKEWEQKAQEKEEDAPTGKLIEAGVMKGLGEEAAIPPEWRVASVIRGVAVVLLVLIVLVTANYLYCNRKAQTKVLELPHAIKTKST